MRIAFVLVFAANIILTIVSFLVLPDEVGIQFGTGGEANSFAGKETNAVIMLAVEAPLFLMLYYASEIMLAVPKQYVSLPNRDYWLRTENVGLTRTKLRRHMDECGLLIFSLLLVIGVLVLRANLRQPPRLDEGAFLVAMAAFAVSLVRWLVRLYRDFRIPEE